MKQKLFSFYFSHPFYNFTVVSLNLIQSMSSFSALLSSHDSHRRRKKKRRRLAQKETRGSGTERTGQDGDGTAVAQQSTALHKVTLESATRALSQNACQESTSVPGTTCRSGKPAPGLLTVVLLVDKPAFSHADVWKRWASACSASQGPHARLVVACRRPHELGMWPEWVRGNVVKRTGLEHQSTARWGSVDELRLLLHCIEVALEAATVAGAPAHHIVMCDAHTLPATVEFGTSAVFDHSHSSTAIGDVRRTDVISTDSGDLPFSRSLQFQCVDRRIGKTNLCRLSPWGLLLTHEQACSLIALDRPAIRGMDIESWASLFNSVPHASEVYFATLLQRLKDAGVTGSVVRNCCYEKWGSPVSRETEASVVSSLDAFATYCSEIKRSSRFIFVRRVRKNLLSLEQWEECVLSSNSKPFESSSAMNAEVPIDSHVSVGRAQSEVHSNQEPDGDPSEQRLKFPRGGRGQRAAWFSDEYLRSVDPPACGAGNKFFIYSTYRLYALMHRKELHFHDKRWLDPSIFGLPLDFSFNSANGDEDSVKQLHRTATNTDLRLIECVFRKTNMYLQWSPLVLSWQKSVRPWFHSFVNRAVRAAESAYGTDISSGSSIDKTLTIHLRTGDIWEARVRSASLANGGFVFYTQPPAWFYAWVAKRYGWFRRAVVVTHVPNSTYTLAVVVALKDAGVETVQVCSGSMLSDFGLLVKARHFVPSISTFAWWAAFLGNGWFRDNVARVSGSRRHIYLGLTGFWHPESEHRSRYNFSFDKESDCGCTRRHTYVLEKSDTWQNTEVQRSKAFAFEPPTWFTSHYGD